MKIFIKFIIVVIGLLIMFYFQIPSQNELICKKYKEFKKLSFDGIIVNKYHDKKNHSNPTIEIITLDKSKTLKIVIIGDRSNMFNQFVNSDTIKKDKDSDVVYKRVNGTYIKYIQADYGCKE